MDERARSVSSRNAGSPERLRRSLKTSAASRAKCASKKSETLKAIAPTLPTFDRSEVKARLENFKATQLKFQMEREQFYAKTMAKARAAQGNMWSDWVMPKD
jgi:hypothetical protein